MCLTFSAISILIRHIMPWAGVDQTIALKSPSILFRDDRNETNFHYDGKICEVNEPINKP